MNGRTRFLPLLLLAMLSPSLVGAQMCLGDDATARLDEYLQEAVAVSYTHLTLPTKA